MALSQPLKAAYWMIGAMISFSLMAISGRELAPELNPFEIMFLRSAIGLIIVMATAHVENFAMKKKDEE